MTSIKSTSSETRAGTTVTRTTYSPGMGPKPPTLDELQPGLRRGASGPEVATLQEALARHFPPHLGGTFDAATEAQVKQFQKDNGLRATGVVDDKTLAALAGSSSDVVVEELVVTSEVPATTVVRTASTPLPGGMVATRTTIAPTGPALGDVKPGNAKDAVGPEVQTIQKRLQSWGFNVSVNSVFDARTEKAVTQFQREMGLPQTGVADAATLEALANEPGAGLATAQALAGPASNALATAADEEAKANEIEKRAAGKKPYGRCAEHVNAALQRAKLEPGGGHANAYGERLPQRADMVEIEGVSVAELEQLPPGAIIVYGKSEAKEWGHVTIVSHEQTAIGQRLESSEDRKSVV